MAPNTELDVAGFLVATDNFDRRGSGQARKPAMAICRHHAGRGSRALSTAAGFPPRDSISRWGAPMRWPGAWRDTRFPRASARHARHSMTCNYRDYPQRDFGPRQAGRSAVLRTSSQTNGTARSTVPLGLSRSPQQRLSAIPVQAALVGWLSVPSSSRTLVPRSLICSTPWPSDEP